ncbi:hypothetical protein G9401_01880 [Weissella paramesenteroides]|uniref:Glyoxalase family protein n=1 Tax=Weissella paramesenteroides ATCC 33313 TaxID=585506 RepID=C5RC00_WEIPA|nr:hypothetical protein [Weissella paramesenteroides]ATF41255.1 hypothetical protein CO680_04010 [Weissella paramesenteroides]EER74287.1 hypothetical protein HMPREF0877_1496 [Weissella paramesenteroides ATCC 33313]MDF8374346.1 hypothetical protein [Weissella paramesenteroides]QPI46348.1 hypothetical protein I2E55_10315 [Weissella paramesenteroides]QPI46351.1 hypothetical protein I2E55_00130 [Weissella paramesenteroides]
MLIIDCVVKDAIKVYQTYATVFETRLIESSKNLPNLSFNEVIFEIEDMQFHLFDANPQMGWQVPDPNAVQSMWFNIVVNDAHALFERAISAGFEVVVPLMKDEELGIWNSVVKDPFNYSWVIEQNIHEVDFSTRRQILNKRIQKLK